MTDPVPESPGPEAAPEPQVVPAAGTVVGKVCPHCDAALASGDATVSCPSCLSPQHAGCWRAQGGVCGSYFCTRETRRDVEDMGPVAIVISHEEAAGADPTARPAPAPRRVAPSPVPVRRDPYATAALVMGLGAAVPLLGCVMGPVSVVVGVLSLGRIGASSAYHGRKAAVAGLLFGVLGTFASLGLVVWQANPGGVVRSPHDSPFLSSHEAPLPPTLEVLENTPPAIRAALRSNVFVEGRYRISAWVGSGIVVDATPTHLRVLTNRHVADGELIDREGVDLTVTTVTGRKVDAAVLWRAPDGVDLALLEAALPDADELVSVAKVAASGKLPQISSPVFAIGNPHGLAWSYTEGKVSSLRDHTMGQQRITFIQTDAPINQGNSGGGLYDMQGRLVGINSWKISDALGEGLSFAIAVKSVLEQREGTLEVEPELEDAGTRVEEGGER